MWRRALLVLLILTAGSAQAELQPFIARYSATLDLLIDLPVTATRELRRLDNGQWQFSSQASAMVAQQSEVSTLNRATAQWQPSYYQFERKVLGRVRNIDIEFDPTNQRIRTIAKGQPWTQPWEPGIQDKLSYQLQLREDLLAGKSDLSYRIADGGQIKTYRFTLAGRERLQTPAGEFDCIRLQLQRSAGQPTTLIWMAPALEYLTVRLMRTDASGQEHFLNLKSVEHNP